MEFNNVVISKLTYKSDCNRIIIYVHTLALLEKQLNNIEGSMIMCMDLMSIDVSSNPTISLNQTNQKKTL